MTTRLPIKSLKREICIKLMKVDKVNYLVNKASVIRKCINKHKFCDVKKKRGKSVSLQTGDVFKVSHILPVHLF